MGVAERLHLVKLFVDCRNVFQVCDKLPHHGAICEREDLRILGVQGTNDQSDGCACNGVQTCTSLAEAAKLTMLSIKSLQES